MLKYFEDLMDTKKELAQNVKYCLRKKLYYAGSNLNIESTSILNNLFPILDRFFTFIWAYITTSVTSSSFLQIQSLLFYNI